MIGFLLLELSSIEGVPDLFIDCDPQYGEQAFSHPPNCPSDYPPKCPSTQGDMEGSPLHVFIFKTLNNI
jgi:hypothetical protein